VLADYVNNSNAIVKVAGESI